MSINILKNEIIQIIRTIAGNPTSTAELVAILFLSIIVSFLVFQKLVQTMKFPLDNASRSTTAFCVTILTAIVAVAVVNIYAVHLLPAGILRQIAGPATAILIILAVANPIACFLFKAKYFQMLLATLLSILVAIAISMLVRGAISVIKYGCKDLEKTREHKNVINQIL